MYLLYTDESNMDPEACEFFIYGGVAIPGDKAQALSVAIDRLRVKHGYRPNDILKFNTRERPSHISPEVHAIIKQEVLENAHEHGVKLFSVFVLHDLAKNPERARHNAINTVCFHFDCYLNWPGVKDVGIVLIDNFDEAHLREIVKEKFSVGVVGLPHSPQYRLERILGVHSACMGSSNFCSLVDIALGCLRYAVNSASDPSKGTISKTLLAQLSPLFIRLEPAGRIHEISLQFSPKTIRASSYLERYLLLHKFLRENGLESAQTPTGEATE